MTNTTIAIPKKLKETLSEYGLKGESYAKIIERLCASARERMIHDLFFSEKNFVPIEDALLEAKKKWPESK